MTSPLIDDSGVTGHKSCYVLEEGTYEIFVGSDVRSAESAGCYEEKFRVVEKLQEACAPVEKFSRMKAVLMPDGSYQAVTEKVPVRTVDPQERRKQIFRKLWLIQETKDISWWMCWMARYLWRTLWRRSVRKI